MAIIRNQGEKKFTKRRTDIDVPAVSRPQVVTTGFVYTNSADIDNDNPEHLYFHIFGQMPSQMSLYIWGERFNQNFYTEVGQHLHASGALVNAGTTLSSSFTSGGPSVSLSHNHGSGGGTLAPINDHHHHIWVGHDDGGFKIDIDGDSVNNGYRHGPPDDGGIQLIEDNFETMNATLTASGSLSHSHNTTVNFGSHAHTISGNTANTGLAPGLGSMHLTGTAKQFFTAMKIAVDGVDQTPALLAQASLAAFGDGTSGHSIVTTGAVLDLSPFVLTPGQHKLTFSLNTGSPNNGGKVRYNLYLL